jgi:hypothetical protein
MAGRHDDHRPLNYAEQAELQRRFPRAGYWLGMLPNHPNIPGHYQQAQYYPPPYQHVPGVIPQPPAPPLPPPLPPYYALNRQVEQPPPYQAAMGDLASMLLSS